MEQREFLVTMTTRVPDGVTEEEVAGVRAREAENTRRLAAEGRVLRLWRPPLAPGEWRTLGLFRAVDEEDLEKVLAAMPLRIWRDDEVTPLGEHPNDAGPGVVTLRPELAEFLTTFDVRVPPGAEPEVVAERFRQEARRTAELAAAGHLLRLWRLPGDNRALGQWQASGPDVVADLLASLPLADWLGVQTVALARHPSDPATAS